MDLKQHYLPRFLIRPFGSGTKRARTVYRFDKDTLEVCRTRVDSAACERAFYDSTIYGEGEVGADGAFNALENQVAPLLRQIIESRNPNTLTDSGREIIIEYVAKHVHRTQSAKSDLGSLVDLLSPTLASRFGSIETSATVQDYFAGFLKSESHLDHKRWLSKKTWVLIEAPRDSEFWLSDEWMMVANPEDSLRRDDGIGNCGFASSGTEIRLPLSPRLCLWWYSADSQFGGALARNGIHAGDEAIPVDVDWVESFRVAAICHSSRFIFAASDDFDFALQFLRNNPQFRQPLRNKMFEWSESGMGATHSV